MAAPAIGLIATMPVPHPRLRAATGACLALVAVLVPGRAGAEEELTLHALAALGDPARIARAISAGAPVDERDDRGRTALHVAAEEANLLVVMMLIAKNADPNARDHDRRTPLHLAADGDAKKEGERFQIVKLLISEGADLSAVDAHGKRPVDYAKHSEFKKALEP